MNASLLAVLNDAERLLVAQTERAELAALDEDAAIDLEAAGRYARLGRPPAGEARQPVRSSRSTTPLQAAVGAQGAEGVDGEEAAPVQFGRR
jgi:hypothetical protein